MTQEQNVTTIGHVLGGLTEDGSNYRARIDLMREKGITKKVIATLEERQELSTVLDMVATYQDDNIQLTDEGREVLYERTDELTFDALRKVLPYVDTITESDEGWDNKVFYNYLKKS